MKERPINMTAEEVRAILYGRKTQFRRVVKTQPPANADLCLCAVKGCGGNRKWHLPCPFGQPGDRLWVRECWADVRGMGFEPGLFPLGAAYRADCTSAGILRIAKEYGAIWSPSIHMPRSLSRITLEVVSVRVKRLNEISGYDAIAEGIEPFKIDLGGAIVTTFRDYINNGFGRAAHQSYRSLWQSIHGPDSWAENPWVWAVEFRRLEGAQ